MFRQLGPAYRPLLEKHNELLRAVWARHGGVEVKTVGDSFVVAFAVAAEALAAAVAAQRAITSHRWPESAALRVRVGVHAGMAFPHGGDYIALALHQASRVVGATNGGTVLVTEETVLMAGDDSDVAVEARRRVPTPRLRSAGRALRRGERRGGARATRRRARGARARSQPRGSRDDVRRARGRARRAHEQGRARTTAHDRRTGRHGQDPARGRARAPRRRCVVRRSLDRRPVEGDERTIGRRRGGRLPRCARGRTRRSFVDPRAPRIALGVAHPRQLRARAAGCRSSGVRHPQRAPERRDPRDESPAARTSRRGGLAHRLASDGRRLGEAVRRPRPLSRPRLLALR